MPKSNQRVIWVLLLALVLMSSCSFLARQEPTLEFDPITETAVPQQPTAMPTYTPTFAPLGSAENPVVIGTIFDQFVDGQNEALETVAMHLSEGLGITFATRSFGNYVDLELALQRAEIHLVWLTAPEYLLASQKNLVSALLVTNHLGVTAYGIQILGHEDSNFVSYYDPATNTSQASDAQALGQLAGLRPCLTEEDSLAGYWVPLGYLSKNNIAYNRPVLTFSFSASIRSLYIKGVCAYTSTYAISADPRTSSEVVIDLPDVIEKIPVIWISPPVIPNLSLSVSRQIDLNLQNRISEFLRNFSREDLGKSLISQALNYEVAQLEPLHNSAYQQLREILLFTDVRLSELTR
ncbi:MAG TPA: phosphate/phosphite/phosphonate ABC transporter substrate-binding protein [Chloroflexi bacterium]|nr:phosphate/phosphite/phosphonate ABC transporter substrate-binding protein [Chloroflexota bacterium]